MNANVPETDLPDDGNGEVPGLVRPSTRRAGKPFLELFPQLFLIPLLLVTIGVLVYLFFHASAKDTRGVSEIIRDMQSAGEQARHQDAFELARRIRERELRHPGGGEYLTSEDTDLLIRLLERFPKERFMRAYVIKTLGRAGQPARTLPLLEELLAAPGTDGVEKISVIQALGFARSPEAVEPLLRTLRAATGPDSWQQRMFAIHALVNIAGARDDAEKGPIAAELRRHLGDAQREVSWNTAYYLARYFQDSSGIGILRKLADVSFLDRQTGDRGREFSDREKRSWMLLAVEGLYELEKGASVEQLREIQRIAKRRRWTRVLNAVNGYLRNSGKAGDSEESRGRRDQAG